MSGLSPRRLGLSGRVVLIIFIAFLTGLLGLIIAGLMTSGLRDVADLPPPARLAALADVVDRTPPARRGRLLAALRAPRFEIRVAVGPQSAPIDGDSLRPFDAALAEAYAEALAGRRFSIAPRPPSDRFRGVLPSIFNDVEFRIGLSDGGTLIVATETPLIVQGPGMPIGYAAGLLGLIISVVALALLHREFRPIFQLANALDCVAPGDETVALPPIRARSPELRALVGAFERLQARVATLIRARLALVGGIQHDVRTFATRLRLRVDGIADADERARAETDIAHIIALLDDALLASRAGAAELDQELIDIVALVRGEVADRHAAGADVSLVVDGDAREAAVLGDRLALRRVLANLLDNAVKYGARARIRLEAASDRAATPEIGEIALHVDDDGPGVPAEHRAALLEPFTRLETSRARRTGGAGLGLAVVRSLVDGHGGSVAIGDAPGGGARVTVRLPLFAPTAAA